MSATRGRPAYAVDWWQHLAPGESVHVTMLGACGVVTVERVEQGRIHLYNGSQINRATQLNYHLTCNRGKRR